MFSNSGVRSSLAVSLADLGSQMELSLIRICAEEQRCGLQGQLCSSLGLPGNISPSAALCRSPVCDQSFPHCVNGRMSRLGSAREGSESNYTAECILIIQGANYGCMRSTVWRLPENAKGGASSVL